MAMAQGQNRLTSIYAADLIGAGMGSLIIVLLLFILYPLTSLYLLSAFGLLAVLIAIKETGKPSVILYTMITCASGTVIQELLSK